MPKIEDRKMTPKENFLRMQRGQEMEWVPIYTMGAPLPNGEDVPVAVCLNSPTNGYNMPDSDGMDVWGVHWVRNDAGGPGTMPEPGRFILEDICDWHDIIKKPDFSDLDWEQVVKDDMKKFCGNINTDMTAIGQEIMIGPFQMLVAFMGFEGAMIAMAEEPEEVHALLDYMMEFYCDDLAKPYAKYLKPDILMIGDDTCAETKPFFSEAMFREFYIPCYQRECEHALEMGIPIEFHNCGVAANFIGITHDECGITGWDPAQASNDLVKFKEDYGGKVAILGGWGRTEQMLKPECDDEIIVESVKETIDRLAPGYGYAFAGHLLGGNFNDPEINRRNDLIMDTALDYAYNFYDKYDK